MEKPALFVLDDGQANGTVFHFCSDKCRRTFETDEDVATGTSEVLLDGTVCDNCGAILTSPMRNVVVIFRADQDGKWQVTFNFDYEDRAIRFYESFENIHKDVYNWCVEGVYPA